MKFGLILLFFLVSLGVSYAGSGLLIGGGNHAASPTPGGACNGPAVPHPAQAAGFTTLAYCADFESNTGTNNVLNGVPGTMNWSTLSNWLDCAGASPSVAQWGLQNYLGHLNSCADISIVNDATAGSNVLLVNSQPGDVTVQAVVAATFSDTMMTVSSVISGSVPNDFLIVGAPGITNQPFTNGFGTFNGSSGTINLNIPATGTPSGNVTLAIPFTAGIATSNAGHYYFVYPGVNAYIEIKERMNTSLPYPCGSETHNWWSEYLTSPTNGLEIDFIEQFGSANGCAFNQQGLLDWNARYGTPSGPNRFTNPNPWDSNYHTIGQLMTSNGSSGAIGQCPYTDGSPASAGAACQSITPTWSGQYTQGSTLIYDNQAMQFGNFASNDFPMYVEWIRVWSCATWNANLPGNVQNPGTCTVASPYTSTPP